MVYQPDQPSSPSLEAPMPDIHEGDSNAFDESTSATAQAPPVVYEDHIGKDCCTSDAEFDNL